MRQLRVYAASTGAVFGAQPENYGDNLMTPLLRELFGIEPRFVSMQEAELIGVGSIIDCYHRRKGRNPFKRRPWRKLHVWGSGFMNERGRAYWPQSLQFHAVRGPLSRNKVRLPNLPLGDPAILIPTIWPKPVVTTRAVSIIPHFITHADFVRNLGGMLPRHWGIVDLLMDPKAISEEIAASDLVISSSLHGLILADAYGIPSIWMRGDHRIKGDGFKFRDYEAFRGRRFGGPIDIEQIFRKTPVPSDPVPPSDTQVEALKNSMPFT